MLNGENKKKIFIFYSKDNMNTITSIERKTPHEDIIIIDTSYINKIADMKCIYLGSEKYIFHDKKYIPENKLMEWIIKDPLGSKDIELIRDTKEVMDNMDIYCHIYNYTIKHMTHIIKEYLLWIVQNIFKRNSQYKNFYIYFETTNDVIINSNNLFFLFIYHDKEIYYTYIDSHYTTSIENLPSNIIMSSIMPTNKKCLIIEPSEYFKSAVNFTPKIYKYVGIPQELIRGDRHFMNILNYEDKDYSIVNILYKSVIQILIKKRKNINGIKLLIDEKVYIFKWDISAVYMSVNGKNYKVVGVLSTGILPDTSPDNNKIPNDNGILLNISAQMDSYNFSSRHINDKIKDIPYILISRNIVLSNSICINKFKNDIICTFKKNSYDSPEIENKLSKVCKNIVGSWIGVYIGNIYMILSV